MSGAAQPEDIRPVVRLAGDGNRAVWLFAGIVGIGAVLLFLALDGRRRALEAPATTVSAEGAPPIAAPPPLAVPGGAQFEAFGYDRYEQRVYPPAAQILPPLRPILQNPPAARTDTRAPVAGRDPAYLPPAAYPFPPAAPPPGDSRQLPQASAAPVAAEGPVAGGPRVRATRLANPAATVPQGTVIPAVLETALDSTRPGAVRAIVSRDVRGFDGSWVLIPRGSRLYGEYGGELQAGQNRALVQWKTLTRPDGVQIALDSPASDPLGRAGVKGKVDDHFLERFGGAILQSVLDAGVAIASRQASDGTVIVGLPGSTQTVGSSIAPRNEVQRTLRVRQGASVSVFVARDLDFSPVEF